ncbi:MAG: MoxR family ATPase [Alkalinema sp. RU_4_3]|nr:MoxR family ATPase [Alkalinema sp. RU_4_3]
MASLKQRKDRSKYQFTGNPAARSQTPHADSPSEIDPYVVDDPELKQAIALAIYLGRPLLLEGEAGCGKTRLAEAIAYELGLPFYRWDIRSTSLAKEGLYEYDALLRLHDVQLKTGGVESGDKSINPANYLRFGALGKAFQLTDSPAVVLIDEIDKADLDFPNDLLTVLDQPWSFEVPEAIQSDSKPLTIGPALHPPIVIITSNREKGALPLPFLRRCIYYYMKFPDRNGLQKIVEAHYGEAEATQATATQATEAKGFKQALVDAAIDRFLKLRDSKALFKSPATSEFLDWLDAMVEFGDGERLVKLLGLEDDKRLPFREVLLKVQKDWDLFSAMES